MRPRACARQPNAKTTEKFKCCVLCALCVLVVITEACGGSTFFKQYEYEEEVFLSLDGTATVYVNGSLAALNALRGTSFDTGPSARVNRDAVRAYYSSANTHVTRVSQSRRSNRVFVHVRLDVDDIRHLGESAPFAWSHYQLTDDGTQYIYTQTIGASAGKDVGNAGWKGQEIVGFRLDLPSRIRYHNTRREVRGNIFEWEQTLDERRRGVPLELDVRMDRQSILYRTLWLFGVTVVAVVIVFVIVIWWIMRRDPRGSLE
jgi:hypothetical protein